MGCIWTSGALYTLAAHQGQSLLSADLSREENSDGGNHLYPVKAEDGNDDVVEVVVVGGRWWWLSAPIGGQHKEAGGREAVGGQLHLVPATVSAAPAAVQARTAESWRARQHTAP